MILKIAFFLHSFVLHSAYGAEPTEIQLSCHSPGGVPKVIVAHDINDVMMVCYEYGFQVLSQEEGTHLFTANGTEDMEAYCPQNQLLKSMKWTVMDRKVTSITVVCSSLAEGIGAEEKYYDVTNGNNAGCEDKSGIQKISISHEGREITVRCVGFSIPSAHDFLPPGGIGGP
ncbi:hypothetical protein JTE90_020343 [Oedothorax gibbosus]|uniref:Uncharacterized protein n=1 Tax=Oedothorax gibbosus TaxID=931172 RepID=A0AAV6TYF7_9ARAC|nr:hypothetical protein JTE90_020343 [Oedothorax gibbosus]